MVTLIPEIPDFVTWNPQIDINLKKSDSATTETYKTKYFV